MPRLPPVTSAVFPATSKRSEAVISPLCPDASWGGQCHRAAGQDRGAGPERLVLDQEGRAVMGATRPVRRSAAEEEVAARQVTQELAHVVARRHRWHPEDVVRAEHDARL